MAYIVNRVTFADVKAARPEWIYVSTTNQWWGHDRAHVSRLTNGIPADPRGATVDQVEAEKWLADVEANASRYGDRGLEVLMAAHHLNCQWSATNDHPHAMKTWTEYASALEASELPLGALLGHD